MRVDKIKHTRPAPDRFPPSQVTADELRGEGRVYGGGLNKIEPKELARISAKKLLAHWPEISSVTDAQSELFANPSLTTTLAA